jgi:hypothetical protein
LSDLHSAAHVLRENRFLLNDKRLGEPTTTAVKVVSTQ